MSGELRMRHWWLIRHAPVNTDRIYGQLDIAADFSDTGRISELARQLPTDADIYVSDLSRCQETARHLLSGVEKDTPAYEIRRDLREQYFGDWQGKNYREVEEDDPEGYAAFWRAPATMPPGGGESFADMTTRIGAALADIAGRAKEESVVIVAHGGPIRAAVGLALGLLPAQMLNIAIHPLSLTRLTSFEGEGEVNWRIDSVNEQGAMLP
ncbi:MAG: histidine phosphatase family protein [Alphaproteobacteria bacterium]|nr:MAG: histidine phosphatase family protein [Alphaproteobacteria bacterium]